MIIDILPAEAFYVKAHQTIYQVALDLRKQNLPCDLTMMCVTLYERGLLEQVGGQAKLAQLVYPTISAINIDVYAKKVLEYWECRQLIEIFHEASALVNDPLSSPGEIKAFISRKVEGLKKAEGKKTPLRQAIAVAREILSSGHSELEENILLEEVRNDLGMGSYDWQHKIIKPLKREIESQRFKLELLRILAIEDKVEQLREISLMAPRFQMSAAVIQQCLKHIEQETLDTSPEKTYFGLDEFLDLEFEGLNWIVPGMLPEGETVILCALPKVGKTLLAIDLAFAVATGEDTFIGEQVSQSRVLLVSTDESARSTKAKLLKRGFRSEDAANLSVMTHLNIDRLGELEKHLEDFRPKLVIIDSLKRITVGKEISENSAEFADAIYKLKELLSRYGAAGLLIHHSNKNLEQYGVGRLRGSTAIAGAVWGTWHLDYVLKQDPKNKNKMKFDPSDPKRRKKIISRDCESQSMLIELNRANNSWVELTEESSQAIERQTQEQQVLELLEQYHPKGLEGREIMETLGVGKGIYTVLSRMVERRIISQRQSQVDRRRMVYCLPHTDPPSGNKCYQGCELIENGQNVKNCLDTPENSLPPPPPSESGSLLTNFPETPISTGIENSQQISQQPEENSQQNLGSPEGVDDSNADTEGGSSIVNNSIPVQGGEGINGALQTDTPRNDTRLIENDPWLKSDDKSPKSCDRSVSPSPNPDLVHECVEIFLAVVTVRNYEQKRPHVAEWDKHATASSLLEWTCQKYADIYDQAWKLLDSETQRIIIELCKSSDSGDRSIFSLPTDSSETFNETDGAAIPNAAADESVGAPAPTKA